MRKPIIGIVASNKKDANRTFNNYTKFVSNFPKRIIESGGTPIGLIFPDSKFIKEEADLCDGFLIQGGSSVNSYSINLIKYAIENKKPLLGICLGMQTMAAYEWVISKLGTNFNYSDIDNYYINDEEFLTFKAGHNKTNPFYEKDIDKSKHDVYLNNVSRLYNIYKTSVISEPSIHNYVVNPKYIGKIFSVCAKSLDGTIEALEINDPSLWIIGVQFHPEIEESNLNLFKFLVEEAKKKR